MLLFCSFAIYLDQKKLIRHRKFSKTRPTRMKNWRIKKNLFQTRTSTFKSSSVSCRKKFTPGRIEIYESFFRNHQEWFTPVQERYVRGRMEKQNFFSPVLIYFIEYFEGRKSFSMNIARICAVSWALYWKIFQGRKYISSRNFVRRDCEGAWIKCGSRGYRENFWRAKIYQVGTQSAKVL